jgi:hypothetical protein
LPLIQFSRTDAIPRIASDHVAAHLVRLDVNADGRYDDIDAMLIARFLIGLRGEGLLSGLPVRGARQSAAAIQSYIAGGCDTDTATTTAWHQATFTESSAPIRSPERGFYAFPSDSFVGVSDATMSNVRSNRPNISLLVAIVRLDEYRSIPLPPSFLDSIAAAFARARNHGFKLILRFAYNYSDNGEDAPLARVLEHISQLAPIVRDNSDVIYVWQGGFIGKWGEMHSSSNGLNTPENEAAIRDALLAALPTSRFLQWRYPNDLMLWDSSPGSESDAFGTSRRARVGLYNDCFMSNDTDVGTYSSNVTTRALQRDYVASRSAIAPFGGETCNASNPEQQRRSCSAILSEGAQFHLTYLNRQYYTGFHDQWAAEGCFATVENSLGYRWVLESLNVPKTAARGQRIQAVISLKNVGWSRLLNARHLQVQLVSRSAPTSTPIVLSSTWDARSLRPNESKRLYFSTMLPQSAQLGEYDVYIAAPDISPSLATNPEFSVRFANTDVPGLGQSWSQTRGSFRSGASVTVQ